MSTGFIGEIRMFGGNFAPHGWASCDGTVLAVSQFPDLFKLIGTTYGGDGVQTFQLPDMRSRIPVHAGTGVGLTSRSLGEQMGEETVALTGSQMPEHVHGWSVAETAALTAGPENAALATTTENIYNPQPDRLGEMSETMVGDVGDQQPHNNMMPSLCVRFIICLFGETPSQT